MIWSRWRPVFAIHICWRFMQFFITRWIISGAVAVISWPIAAFSSISVFGRCLLTSAFRWSKRKQVSRREIGWTCRSLKIATYWNISSYNVDREYNGVLMEAYGIRVRHHCLSSASCTYVDVLYLVQSSKILSVEFFYPSSSSFFIFYEIIPDIVLRILHARDYFLRNVPEPI